MFESVCISLPGGGVVVVLGVVLYVSGVDEPHGPVVGNVLALELEPNCSTGSHSRSNLPSPSPITDITDNVYVYISNIDLFK